MSMTHQPCLRVLLHWHSKQHGKHCKKLEHKGRKEYGSEASSSAQGDGRSYQALEKASNFFGKNWTFSLFFLFFGFGLVIPILCLWLCYGKENKVNFFMGVIDWSLVTFEFTSIVLIGSSTVFFVALNFCAYHDGILKPSAGNTWFDF